MTPASVHAPLCIPLLLALAATPASAADPAPRIAATAAETHSPACRVSSLELQAGIHSGTCHAGLAQGEGTVHEAGTGRLLYQGHFSGGLRDGQGQMHYPNGDEYAGAWHQDRRQGVGSYRFGTGSPWAGDRYKGHWHADRFHGRGRYEWITGDHYDGAWDNGQQTGPATAAQLRRQVYVSALLETLPRTDYRVCSIGTDPRWPSRSARVTSVVEDRLLLQATGSDAPSWQPAALWRPCPPSSPLD